MGLSRELMVGTGARVSGGTWFLQVVVDIIEQTGGMVYLVGACLSAVQRAALAAA